MGCSNNGRMIDRSIMVNSSVNYYISFKTVNFLLQKTSAPKTHREERFEQFASVQCEGVIYMTPQDFLESVTEEVPRRMYNILKYHNF